MMLGMGDRNVCERQFLVVGPYSNRLKWYSLTRDITKGIEWGGNSGAEEKLGRFYPRGNI